MNHVISIDRASQKWAIFTDDFEIVKPFTSFESEVAVVLEAIDWCKEHGSDGHEIVYPRITAFKTFTK